MPVRVTELRLVRGETEHEQVRQLAKRNQATKDFAYCWDRWKNWEKHPPLALIENGKVVSFAAFTTSKRTGYLYLYFIATDPAAYRKRYGAVVFSRMLDIGRERGMRRVKLKTAALNLRAQRFFEGMGLKPTSVDERKQELLYDMELGCVV